MINSQVTVENSTFSHNVGAKGGAIAFECTSGVSCDLQLVDVLFDSNRGQQQGGALEYNYFRPSITG